MYKLAQLMAHEWRHKKMISINAQIKKIAGLAGTKDVTPWESGFIDSIVTKTNEGRDVSGLTEKQIDSIERIHNKHFA